MKKIIAILLVLVILLVAAAGVYFHFFKDKGEEISGVEVFKQLYSVSQPTKVVVNQTTTLGAASFKGTSILVTGVLADGKAATVYTYNYEVLQSVESGAGDVIKPIMGEPIRGSREYVEGQGERNNGGAWDETGMNFAPKAGSIAINLDETKLNDCVYSENGGLKTLSFTVLAKNTSDVFGEEYGLFSDVKVVITANDAVVTGITISYSELIESEDEDIAYPEANISITTVYTYDIEEITLVKN